jgi:hypothetical membrane protein
MLALLAIAVVLLVLFGVFQPEHRLPAPKSAFYLKMERIQAWTAAIVFGVGGTVFLAFWLLRI